MNESQVPFESGGKGGRLFICRSHVVVLPSFDISVVAPVPMPTRGTGENGRGPYRSLNGKPVAVDGTPSNSRKGWDDG